MSKTNLEILNSVCDKDKVPPLQPDGEFIVVTPKEFDAYTARICAEKDVEIARLNRRTPDAWVEIERQQMVEINLHQQLSEALAENARLKTALSGQTYFVPPEFQVALDEANALIAMQQEALNKLLCVNSNNSLYQAIDELRCVDFASAESVADWEAEKLLPMQRQVAMLHRELKSCAEDMEDWAGYANQYFQEKHGLASDCARYAKVLSDTQATAEAYDREVKTNVLEEALSRMGEESWTVIQEMIAELRSNKKG